MQDTIGPVSGLAFLLELHYTHTLQDSDMIRAGTLFGSTARLQNVANRQDVVNFTIGLHTQMMDDTAIRVGAVFPLREHDNRLFDSELTVQVNRRF